MVELENKIIGFRGIDFLDLYKSGEIVYVESEYNEEVNEYISHNYDSISEALSDYLFSFQYNPKVIEKLYENDELSEYYGLNFLNIDTVKANVSNGEILQYAISDNFKNNTPPSLFMTVNTLRRYKDIQEADSYGIIIKIPQPISPESIRIAALNMVEVVLYLKKLDMEREEQCLCYRMVEDDKDEDDYFHAHYDNETLRLIREMKENIERLKQKGITGVVLKKIIQEMEKTSRLVVTTDFRMILKDFNNQEITMAPLPKAIFFLFLRHPEGISFKELIDYKDEIMHIYKVLCNGNFPSRGKKSIESICNPLNNSINEKCSRIAEAFKYHFDEDIVSPYIIRGERGCKKSICVDRQLVTWECGDIMDIECKPNASFAFLNFLKMK